MKAKERIKELEHELELLLRKLFRRQQQRLAEKELLINEIKTGREAFQELMKCNDTLEKKLKAYENLKDKILDCFQIDNVKELVEEFEKGFNVMMK